MVEGHTLGEQADTASIYSEVLENACAWNPVAQVASPPTPFTLNPTPYTLNPTPYTLNHQP